MRRVLGATAAAFVFVMVFAAKPASAAAIYVTGNECPSDAQMPSYSRQYGLPQATNCVFDPSSSNIQGDNGEAATYLNGGPQPTWGTGWVGLGQNPSGFTFTTDGGNDDGTFSINTSTLNYAQFAVGIKDGADPKWAIFLLPAGTTSGDWHFLTDGGDLSHFALYGRGTPTSGGGAGAGGGSGAGQTVPEPATLTLMGLALAGAVYRARQRRE